MTNARNVTFRISYLFMKSLVVQHYFYPHVHILMSAMKEKKILILIFFSLKNLNYIGTYILHNTELNYIPGT